MTLMLRLAGIAAFLVWGGGAFAASPVDGTEWSVEITPEGKPSPDHIDRVKFEKGEFNSVIFRRQGFFPSPYSAAQKGKGTAWEVDQKNELTGSLHWQGEVEGEALKGTLVWKKPDGKVFRYSLVGNPAPPLEEPAEAQKTPAADKDKAKAEVPPKKEDASLKKYLPSFLSTPDSKPAPAPAAPTEATKPAEPAKSQTAPATATPGTTAPSTVAPATTSPTATAPAQEPLKELPVTAPVPKSAKEPEPAKATTTKAKEAAPPAP